MAAGRLSSCIPRWAELHGAGENQVPGEGSNFADCLEQMGQHQAGSGKGPGDGKGRKDWSSFPLVL